VSGRGVVQRLWTKTIFHPGWVKQGDQGHKHF